ncbi:GNAT family N-acetyltransferase [Saccharophagus sp. K07]|uniref:GNAT family N-acetyltransferase n=1 Tax=Saccharophagus sp. K07 TaxID=2283636 RepID=UPI001652420F|nr:GNAT family N-acetyltransferase [Saccharophagus sp. K07]MBC6905343.1 GNAT family N-acetyltransferase [Saccharophagus sp. K07]
MEIVRAEADDCAAIARILARSWQTAYRGIMSDELLDNISVQRLEQGWKENLNSGIEAYLLWLSGEAIGVVEVSKFRDPITEFSTWGEIPIIYLLPEYYGFGLGGKLMRFALSLLRERGMENVGVWALEKNSRAIRFYKKHGFLLSQHTKVHKPTSLLEVLLIRQSP